MCPTQSGANIKTAYTYADNSTQKFMTYATCNAGYYSLANNTAYCQPDGNWSNTLVCASTKTNRY